jgi:iduronate 2-sulfatase
VVEFVDIYPTVAEWCGLRGPVNLAGRSLLPLLRAPATHWDGVAFTQILRPGRMAPSASSLALSAITKSAN